MFRGSVYAALILILSCTACAPSSPSSKQGLVLEQQSIVRWYADMNLLEVYVAIANQDDTDASFTPYVVFLNPHLRKMDGLVRTAVKKDDRGGRIPFLLKPHEETVLVQTFSTNEPLKQEWLFKGVGIEIAAQGKRYTLPIKYGEVEGP